MKKATFYHAGCPVCVSAEQGLVNGLDRGKYDVESVHLGQNPGRIAEAEKRGVKTLPALIIEDQVFHINFGASLSDLKTPPEHSETEELVVAEDYGCCE